MTEEYTDLIHQEPLGESNSVPPVRPRKKFFRNIFKKKWVKALLALIIIAALAFTGLKLFFGNQRASETQAYRTAEVSRQTIQSSLSSSGTLEALDTYSITSLVSGEVISADFEEGDQVEKGDVLYEIDTDSVDEKIADANTTLERAQEKYQDAQEDYESASEKYQTLNYESTLTGYVKTLYVEEGDTIQNGTQLMELYNDSIMVLKIPFPASQADEISVGDTAQVTVSETYETLTGTVTAVSSMEQTLTGGVITRMVTIEVENPGALTSDHVASATINGIVCSGDGSFSPKLEKIVTADRSGEIDQLQIEEGSYVSAGSTLFTLTRDSVEDALSNVESNLEAAEQSLEDAQTNLENQQDSLSDYEITAPISGQVIVKNTKAGDTLNNNSGSTAMAIIYDMSSLTFEMSVDEMDVLSVAVGQKVEVVADALEDQTFTGVVTNVSLQSSYSNGVTNYPVTVQVDEIGDLLPGMNVTAKIILEESTDTLAIPAEALMRGNTVYVKDDSVTESTGNIPAGFRAVEVETGLISSDYVEILSGLSEGDEVYIDASTSTDSTAMGPMGNMGPMGGDMGNAMGGMPGGGGGMPAGGSGGGMPGGRF